MRSYTKIVLLFSFFCSANMLVISQELDSVFSFSNYISTVQEHHPVVVQANLKVEYGQAKVLTSKGSLDPRLDMNWDEKSFENKQYYRKYQALIRVPTPIGLDVVGGYGNASGDYLNPENKTGDYGLWRIGIELDVLQGLIVNERRIAIMQADEFSKMALNQQSIILNELMYNAISAYFQWQLYYSFNEVLIENMGITEVYLENTTQSFFAGEKTALDTLEAHILYKDAAIALQKNEMELLKSMINVENYLWYDNVPVGIKDSVVPENFTQTVIKTEMVWNDTSMLANNPTIMASMNKLSILELEQKLKREKLKPKLKLKFNPLISTNSSAFDMSYAIDDYTWGLAFSMPLFLRSARGDIQQSELKILDLESDILNKRNMLQNKIENSWQQQLRLANQQYLLTENVSNYKRLLEGESERFVLGESSLFLVNKRQEKYIAVRLKLIDNYLKQQSERLKYLYFTNQLIDN